MFKFSSVSRVLAWSLLFTVFFVTISPIGLRPHTLTTVNLDRAAAFAAVAMLFVLAYPDHWKRVGLLLIGGAVLFEILQMISPTRHAHVEDALVKSFGVLVGVAVGYVTSYVVALVRPPLAARPVPARKD
ncbi:VanZ family protein [Ciceribacter sp. RN22]|uniref:VanZ family protein n=1 Tax=Ciceribacter sp. RN22 TaxID=2954932 RepID=UPI0020930DC6|nr:VanZ family protein [Ciceribacter sp. RN22]MCO6176879.1 VanZ family protein [Ciceribacter sp. RN22]